MRQSAWRWGPTRHKVKRLMALEDYKRKRDFTKSPEPTGDEKHTPGKAPFFCVQKHLASHLHYDFRLEHNGVLLSWAVPKGPSLDPSIKRLAMHVEDHPVAYGSFEGVMPEGYGAGIVMLWDTGTWTPLVSDVDAALEKGDLKFSLDGYKLKGSWALVRTRGFGRNARNGSRDENDGRSWLLIKHRDEWSGDLDIATFAPLSVKSRQDLHEILAEDTPAIWHSRPVVGGETGKLLKEVVERAAALKAERLESKAPVRSAASGRATEETAATPSKKPAATRKARTTKPAAKKVAKKR